MKQIPENINYFLFWGKVKKLKDCWEWQSTIKKDGYGYNQ